MKRSLAILGCAVALLLALLLLYGTGVFSANLPVPGRPDYRGDATPVAVAYFPCIARNVTNPPPLPPLLPDLQGYGGYWSRGVCFTETYPPVYTAISVGNYGSAPAGPFVVRANGWWEWYLPGLGIGQYVHTDTGYLPAGLWVDADDQVVESNEDNNRIWFPTVSPLPRCTDVPPTVPTPIQPCQGTPDCGPTATTTPPCRAGLGCGPTTPPTPSPSPSPALP